MAFFMYQFGLEIVPGVNQPAAPVNPRHVYERPVHPPEPKVKPSPPPKPPVAKPNKPKIPEDPKGKKDGDEDDNSFIKPVHVIMAILLPLAYVYLQ